jgi:addiction module RelE/StbE family toxin
MEIRFKIEYLEVVEKQVASIPSNIKNTIKNAIEERLTTNPVELGKPLRYSFKGHRRMRVGNYRIIYRIEDLTKTIIIIAIKHRKDIYE